VSQDKSHYHVDLKTAAGMASHPRTVVSTT